CIIAFREKLSYSTVLKIKNLKKQTSCLDVLPRPDHLRILTTCHKRRIVREFRSDTCQTAVQAQKKLKSDEGVCVSTNTIH
ncbi:3294_t:CDS:1, partial [Racocetra fulgida]